MLINEQLANKNLATPFGLITFNEKGENDELTVEQQKELAALPAFAYEEPKKAAPKAKASKSKAADKEDKE